MPGHPAAIMGNITPVTDFTTIDTKVYDFTLHQYGQIGNDENGNACGNVGDEFNPLAEKLYGVPNPYADPSRGAINS